SRAGSARPGHSETRRSAHAPGIALGRPFIEMAGQVVDATGAPPQLAIADRQNAYAYSTMNLDFALHWTQRDMRV
ncbi:MAG: hypothetical protein L0H94_16700, partial [Nitrospira sp.]|nr:hypothetical protein [Nitrospira sp.]